MAWEFESPPGHQLERMSFGSDIEALFLRFFALHPISMFSTPLHYEEVHCMMRDALLKQGTEKGRSSLWGMVSSEGTQSAYSRAC